MYVHLGVGDERQKQVQRPVELLEGDDVHAFPLLERAQRAQHTASAPEPRMAKAPLVTKPSASLSSPENTSTSITT